MRMLRINMLGGVSALAMIARAPADDDGEPLGVVEFEDNLGDVEKPPVLPAGVYEGEVQDIQKQTSQKGNPYYAIKFTIPPDEIAADVRDDFPDGADLYWNRQVVPGSSDRRALWNLRRLLESLGMETNITSFDPNSIMGAKARLRVRHSTYQGETRAEISAIESAEVKASTKGRSRQAAADEDEAETKPRKAAGGRSRR